MADDNLVTSLVERILDERWLAHRKEHEMLDEARKLQAAENLRRFDSLNGEAGRLVKMQTDYLPREVGEARHKEHAAQLMVLTNKQIELAGVIAQNNIALSGQATANATEIGRLSASITWLTRLIWGALIAAAIAYLFQRMGK